MIVLEKYILKRVFVQTIAVILVSFGIVWTIQTLTKVNLVTDNGQSIGAFLLLAALLLPAMIPIVLPFALLIATINSLYSLNSDSELAIINASGASRFILFKPIFIVACGAAIVTLISSHFVEPYSRQAARDLVSKAKSNLITLVIQEGTFKKIDDNLYISIFERLPNGVLRGIFVSDSRDASFNTVYYARQGEILQESGTHLLVMRDGEIQRRNMKTGRVSLIRFTSYAFDISQFTTATGKPSLFPKDQTTSYLLSPDVNDPLFQENPLVFSAEFHKRWSKWLYCIAFSVLGFALCGQVRSHRDHRFLPYFSTLILAFSIRWLGIVAEDQAEKEVLFSIYIYLVPLGAIVISLWLIYTQRILKKGILL